MSMLCIGCGGPGVTSCDLCGEQYCKKCWVAFDCDHCGETCCEACFSAEQCDMCGEEFCSQCFEHLTCTTCGDWCCSVCVVEEGVCPRCDNTAKNTTRQAATQPLTTSSRT